MIAGAGRRHSTACCAIVMAQDRDNSKDTDYTEVRRLRAGDVALAITAAAAPAATSASTGPRSRSADALVADFVYQSLALQPVAASAAGYHVHDSVRLDGRWDDYSAAGLEQLRQFNRQLLHRLDALAAAPASMPSAWPISTSSATPSSLEACSSSIASRISATTRRVYVELIGNGLYTPYVLELRARRSALPATSSSACSDCRRWWRRPRPTCATRPKCGTASPARRTTATSSSSTRRCARSARPRCTRRTPAAAGPALQSLREFSSFPGHDAGGQDQRLATRQGQLRAQVPLHAAHRAHDRAAAGRRRSGPRRHARRDGAARRAAQRDGGAGRVRRASTRRPPPTWTRPAARSRRPRHS